MAVAVHVRTGRAPSHAAGRRRVRGRASPLEQFLRMSSKILTACKAGDSEALARLLQGGAGISLINYRTIFKQCDVVVRQFNVSVP